MQSGPSFNLAEMGRMAGKTRKINPGANNLLMGGLAGGGIKKGKKRGEMEIRYKECGWGIVSKIGETEGRTEGEGGEKGGNAEKLTIRRGKTRRQAGW